MLANRLSILLAERQLTNKQIVEDTGLSRNSVSNIATNPYANISTATVDTLCNYLGVSPTEFWEFSPYEIKTKNVIEEDKTNADFLVSVLRSKKELLYPYDFTVRTENDVDNGFDRGSIEDFDLIFSLGTLSTNDEFVNIYSKLQPIFQTKISEMFVSVIKDIILNNSNLLTVYDENAFHTEGKKLSEFFHSTDQAKFKIVVLLPWEDIKITYDSSKNKII